MKTGLKKIIASLLVVAFLWSTLSMVQAQAGVGDHKGSMSSGMGHIHSMDGAHRTVADMSMPATADMHCDKAGGMGNDCSSHCSLCCASIAQYRFHSTAYSPGLMPAPAFFVAGIVIPTQDRPPRLTLA